MSEMRVDQPEALQLSTEAVQFAAELTEHIKGALDEEVTQTGHAPTDRSNQRLRELDRAMQTELDGTGFIYFGHTRKIDDNLYDALRAGYDPTPEQVAASDGADFLWDEVLELRHNHPDINQLFNKYGYGSKETPVAMSFTGARAIPEDTLKQILGILYERGREYRSWGWGFPWYSDEIADTEAIK